ncbi:UDP-glucose:glycoprotein glucosyltransferase 1 isoform X1 [Lingula anatina]|uniref:UDP-glucose:glycoprotein glucosyltransferase 1 isoform X1 n=1 Tax=Lingula anatina TaxID=7574 RepID=A0A1S3JCA8_LINAN|nr:UDP-glucose:glycoprotein glucosyltransferase 1 isoform X1 [Lingula anatina]|eukprot:XP_013407519.1 UDP-glucose:glycoprotein glucosyltransferase 1 isoform X1 [Lingula anatina]
MTNKELTASLAASMVYMKRQEEADKHPITMWVVADLSSPAGRAHLYSAVKHLKHSHTLRVGIVHNPRSPSTKLYRGSQIPLAIHTALGSQVPHIARSFVTKLLKEDNIHAILEGTESLSDLEVHGMVMEVYLKALDVQTMAFLQFHSAFCTQVLGFEPGAQGVIVNGRIIGPLKDQKTFIEDDYNLLEKYTQKSSAEKIVQMLTGFTEDTKRVSDMVMQVGSLLMSNQQASIASRTDVQFAGDQHSVLKIPAKPEEPAYDVTFIVDPVSREAQKVTPLLRDLPNNMIHQVNIKSLPQEWMWCETWCSDDEKSKAKTIDLCNNLQTKEPKLNAAKRKVAEWEEYDNEERRIFENFTSNKPTLGSLSADHIEAQETSTQPRDEL